MTTAGRAEPITTQTMNRTRQRARLPPCRRKRNVRNTCRELESSAGSRFATTRTGPGPLRVFGGSKRDSTRRFRRAGIPPPPCHGSGPLRNARAPNARVGGHRRRPGGMRNRRVMPGLSQGTSDPDSENRRRYGWKVRRPLPGRRGPPSSGCIPPSSRYRARHLPGVGPGPPPWLAQSRLESFLDVCRETGSTANGLP